MTKQPPIAKSNESLSDREIEVVQLLSDGLTHKKAADKLFISKKTIARHCESVRKKFNNKKIIQIVKITAQQGIIK